MAFNAFLGKSNPEDKGKKQKIALMAVVVLILAGGAVAYFNFFYSTFRLRFLPKSTIRNSKSGSHSGLKKSPIESHVGGR